MHPLRRVARLPFANPIAISTKSTSQAAHHRRRICGAPHPTHSLYRTHPQLQECSETLSSKIKVVGMGNAVLTTLPWWPHTRRPDDKLRTERLELQGGGNCANALTATARLGLFPTLVTKIGDDAMGGSITSSSEGTGWTTSHHASRGGASPFTYSIVDREGGTRTCNPHPQ